MKKLGFLSFFILIFGISLGQGCEKASIYFKPGRFLLTSENKQIIDSILTTLNPDSTYLFEIQGHTSRIGSNEKNRRLSDKRRNQVLKYIGKQKTNNLTAISRAYGESKPISDKRQENRRVEIRFLPINPDKTITLHAAEDNRSEIRVPVHYFNQCGICDTFPQVKMNSPDQGRDINVTLSSPCAVDVQCVSAIFRFPRDKFEQNPEINVPMPLYVKNCGLGKKDSTNVKANDRFDIRFDTLTDEYVVTHECFTPGWTICCGTINTCTAYKFHLPDTLNGLITSYYTRVPDYSGEKVKWKDSLIVVKDSTEFTPIDCRMFKPKIWGIGYLNGELLFMEEKVSDLELEHKTYRGYYNHTNAYAKIPTYKPLAYDDQLDVMIKVKRSTKLDFVDYYIEQFDYTVPFQKVKKTTFLKPQLLYKHKLGVHESGGQLLILDLSLLKGKYKKKKNYIKYKIRKKDLKKATTIPKQRP